MMVFCYVSDDSDDVLLSVTIVMVFCCVSDDSDGVLLFE